MGLHRLIYWSVPTQPLRLADIRAIEAVANTANRAFDLTGMLACSRDYFLQVLEGEPEPINRLYANILRDPRHRDVHLLAYAPAEKRRFSHWDMAMGWVGDLPQQRAALLKHTGAERFDPSVLTGPQAIALLEELSGTLRRGDGTLAAV